MERDLEMEGLRRQVERLERRVAELEARWDSDIPADLRELVADLRGTVTAQEKLLGELHARVLRSLLP
jgi:hypothetical protein